VTGRGNFESKNILELVGSLEEREALAGARPKLFEVREARIHPGHDDKVLTSWNGLMLAAFAEAARTLEREDYREAATAFTHPQAHARQVYEALVSPPTSPSDLGLEPFGGNWTERETRVRREN
jgi:uncharacterized protein YyaL (SSP411 family)